MNDALTVQALLERAGRVFPANYAVLHRRARGLAAGLLAAGLRPGDRIATLLWNQPEHLEAYFAVPAAGLVLHPLNLRLHPHELARIAAHAGDRWLIADASLAPLTAEMRLERALFVQQPEFAALHGDPAAPLPAVAESDAAAICHTSGTTGDAKGVVYTHRALALHALAVALPDCLNFRAADVAMPLVPMFHANAWGIPHAAAMVGARLVLPGAAPTPERILDLLAGEGVTRSAGVPALWQGVLDRLEAQPGRWRLHPELRVNLGGASAPASLFARFDRAGIACHMGWGMTEMSPVGTMNPHAGPAAPPEVRVMQGRPLPFIDIRARGNDGAEIAWDGRTRGELEVRGPWVATAYLGGADAGAWTPDGWFRTGDIVTISPGAMVHLVDRRKDLIRSGGEWISSVALENALSAHPSVLECAVIAVPHARWQERPLALVVPRGGAALDADALRAHLAAEFAAWQAPDAFVAVAALPRTGTGKIDKKQLRREFGAGS